MRSHTFKRSDQVKININKSDLVSCSLFMFHAEDEFSKVNQIYVLVGQVQLCPDIFSWHVPTRKFF